MRRLDRTSNFLRLYLHAAGLSKIPREYHQWAALALLAALVQDRVWLEKFKDSRLAPNLYVLLIGPSGSGKGVAIDRALKLLPDLPHLGYFRGKVTAPRLVDYMGRKHKGPDGRTHPPSPKCFLVTPEVSLSLGAGNLADELVKMLTEMFTGGDYTFQHGTRISGDVLVHGPCPNWLGGSIPEWFLTALTPEAIRGGALARMCLIAPREGYDELGIATPIYPPDYDETMTHLRARALSLAFMSGKFEMTGPAAEMERRWNLSRQPPTDEDMKPAWRREPVLLLKLAMLLSLAEGGDLVIAKRHIREALPLLRDAHRPMAELVQQASAVRDTRLFKMVSSAIKVSGRINRSVLLRRFSTKGLTRDILNDIVGTLETEHSIVTEYAKPHGRVSCWYRWRSPAINGKRGEDGEGE